MESHCKSLPKHRVVAPNRKSWEFEQNILWFLRESHEKWFSKIHLDQLSKEIHKNRWRSCTTFSISGRSQKITSILDIYLKPAHLKGSKSGPTGKFVNCSGSDRLECNIDIFCCYSVIAFSQQFLVSLN